MSSEVFYAFSSFLAENSECKMRPAPPYSSRRRFFTQQNPSRNPIHEDLNLKVVGTLRRAVKPRTLARIKVVGTLRRAVKPQTKTIIAAQTRCVNCKTLLQSQKRKGAGGNPENLLWKFYLISVRIKTVNHKRKLASASSFGISALK